MSLDALAKMASTEETPNASLARRESEDERLAREIAAYFVFGAPFPERHGFALAGHPGLPPARLGRAWPDELAGCWIAFSWGSSREGLRRDADGRLIFRRAASVALAVSQDALHLQLGAGGRLLSQSVPVMALDEIGPGDLLFLRARAGERLERGVGLRVDWPRGLGALLLGLRASACGHLGLPGTLNGLASQAEGKVLRAGSPPKLSEP